MKYSSSKLHCSVVISLVQPILLVNYWTILSRFYSWLELSSCKSISRFMFGRRHGNTLIKPIQVKELSRLYRSQFECCPLYDWWLWGNCQSLYCVRLLFFYVLPECKANLAKTILYFNVQMSRKQTGGLGLTFRRKHCSRPRVNCLITVI